MDQSIGQRCHLLHSWAIWMPGKCKGGEVELMGVMNEPDTGAIGTISPLPYYGDPYGYYPLIFCPSPYTFGIFGWEMLKS